MLVVLRVKEIPPCLWGNVLLGRPVGPENLRAGQKKFICRNRPEGSRPSLSFCWRLRHRVADARGCLLEGRGPRDKAILLIEPSALRERQSPCWRGASRKAIPAGASGFADGNPCGLCAFGVFAAIAAGACARLREGNASDRAFGCFAKSDPSYLVINCDGVFQNFVGGRGALSGGCGAGANPWRAGGIYFLKGGGGAAGERPGGRQYIEHRKRPEYGVCPACAAKGFDALANGGQFQWTICRYKRLSLDAGVPSAAGAGAQFCAGRHVRRLWEHHTDGLNFRAISWGSSGRMTMSCRVPWRVSTWSGGTMVLLSNISVRTSGLIAAAGSRPT